MPKSTEKSRVLRELLETAIDLKTHGLLSNPEMARMNALCEKPPSHKKDPAARQQSSCNSLRTKGFRS